MRIKKTVLESILELCKEAYPNEVSGIMLNNPVDDFVIVPGKFNRGSVDIDMNAVPIYPSMQGTFHSHPNADNNASAADRRFFGSYGKNHLIVAYPYSLKDIQCYSSKCEKKEFEVV